MSYDYATERHYVFSEKGQAHFLYIRDLSKHLLKEAGAVMCDRLLVLGPRGCATSWEMLACVDRLVELGELQEIPNIVSSAGQHRIFIKK